LILTTSPIAYPIPDVVIVAAIAIPPFTRRSAFAPIPFPVIVVKLTFEYIVGLFVYPIPGLVIVNVPVVPVQIPPKK